MQIGLIYTVSTLLPGMEITNTALLVGHEIKLPSRICVAPEGKLLQATQLSAVFSLPPKLLTETFRQRKRYIWLQLHITRSIETQMLMAELNNKQLGINVKIRKSILNTHISQIPWNSSTVWGRTVRIIDWKSIPGIKTQKCTWAPWGQDALAGLSWFCFTKDSLGANKGYVIRSFSGSGHASVESYQKHLSFLFEFSRMRKSYFMNLTELNGKVYPKCLISGLSNTEPRCAAMAERCTKEFLVKGI